MKRIIFIALLLFAAQGSLLAQQSRTNQIYRPCPGTTTPARVSIAASGAITVAPCATLGVAGDIFLTGSVGKSGTAVAPAADGGAIEIVSGAGGVTTTAGDSGDGGIIQLVTGDGGASTVAAGNTSGIGGNLTIGAGDGGDRTGASGTAGNGGNVVINAGAGGQASGGASAGSPGEIRIGTTVRSNVEIGKGLSVTTIGDTQGDGNGTLLTIDDAAGDFLFAGASASFAGGVHVGGGTITIDRTITAIGTTGNQTINKLAGTINVAAAAAAVTLTNSFISVNSIILPVVRTADSTCTFIKSVVAGSGSAVITMNAGCTAATSIGFVVTN